MKLRPYQSEAARAVVDAWRDNRSTLVVMPTGLGKTVLFADVIRRVFPRRALVLAHREELIFQAQAKIKAVTGLSAEIEMADMRANMGGDLLGGSASVVVSTVQTMTAGGDGSGRMTRFNPDDFGVLIIDEAHHATAGSYRRVIDWFTSNDRLRVLGVTATPDRSDEEALGQVFETVAFDYDILHAVSDGWLVPIEQQMVEVSGLDFSSIRTTAGDLNGADLARVMEHEEALHKIAHPSIDIISDRRAIVFCSSVAHAERLSEIFNRHRGGMAGWVCGATPKEERRRTLSRFAASDLQVVCNCGVLTEGFDDPGVEVIIMGRPTKSRALYAQMVGRGTRPLPGVVDGPETAEERRAAIEHSQKAACLVVDFVGNSGRHKLMTTADILGGNVSDQAMARAVERAKREGKPMRMDEALLEEQHAIAEERRAAEAAQRARLTVRTSYQAKRVDPFDAFQIEPPRERGWDAGRQLSDKQRSMLEKQGIDPDTVSFSQGKALISEIFRRWDAGLCSYKQAKLLQRYGYDASNMSRDEASSLIDQLAKNGWRSAV